MAEYNHKKIEAKWQEKWRKDGLYRTPDVLGKPRCQGVGVPTEASGKNFYTLVELPYPSGDLHVGHWYAFSVPDIFARMKRMQGYNVLYPMGFDAFGLPAENAAIKNKTSPSEWTWKNIERARTQLRTMGATFDWSREVVTCDPQYYQWTQWLFLQLYKKGLAYHGKALVNWDPVDKTVLANEQVLPDGTAERSGAKVEKKELEQWFLKITDYADRLIDDLDVLDWPEPIKEAQRNWIGRSEGAEISFELRGQSLEGIKRFVLLHGYTGTPDGGWFPWLQTELEARGYEVEAPQLPNDPSASDDEQVEYALQHCSFDEATAVIGHSFGGVVALRLLERGIKVAQVILVAAPFSGSYLDGKDRPTVTVAVKKGFDVEKIKKHAKDIVLLYDLNDDVVAVSDGKIFSDLIGTPVTQTQATEPHFAAKKELDVLTACIPSIKVFTTRPDTLFGATYLVLAPEHPAVPTMINHSSNREEVRHYIDVAVRKGELERQENKEKTGVELKGVKAINPGTKEKIPIFIADYVLSGYGTGAIMAVPAHDERDAEFAKTKNLPVRSVISDEGILIESGEFNGLSSEEAKKKITEFVGGRMVKTYRQRDWLISRQRYWGTPIPIVYDPEGNAHAVPDEHLPWLLPTDVDFTPTGEAPLARSKELKERTEKLFGTGWTPEVDTMDVFMDSSWYFLRYLDPNNKSEFASKELQKTWMPVERYSGGAEHTTVHILYSRFFIKALYDLGLVTESEPYKVRMNRGLILAEDGRKMSKRWGNVINPDDQVANIGADSVRTYFAFIGPYNEVGSFPWNTNGLIGVRRFLERVWNLREKVTKSEVTLYPETETLLHQSIKKVGDDIESMKFNTSVSALMILSNEFQKRDAVPQEAYEVFLKLLAPFAPHITEELWEKLGHSASIHLESWPDYSPKKAAGGDVVIAIQRNGKTKTVVSIFRGASEHEVISFLKENEKTAPLVPENPQRIIFVPEKVINFIA